MPTQREAETGVNRENFIGQVFLDRWCWSVAAGIIRLRRPVPRSSTAEAGGYGGPTEAATGRGARMRPRKNPATNPQRCAAMLTCGVERSKAVWIAMIIKIFARRCFACGA